MTMTREPIRPIKLEKPNRKINFDKEDIEADGKITLELFTDNITQLFVDLQSLGEPVVSFGHTVVHRFDASKIPALEKLDSIVFGRVPSRPVRTNPPIPTSSALQKKEGRKVSFAKADVDASGKIALDLVANDINQLVRDLYDIGVDGISTFGNTVSVKIDASKIPALEQLPSLAFGRTPKRESSIEDENQRGNQNKSQTEVGDSAGQNTRETNEEGVVSLSAPKEASQDKKGADLSVTRVKGHIRAVEDALELIATRVKGQPRAESDLFNARQTGASGFTSERTPIMISQRGERKISYDGMNFTSWKEGTPQPMPTESKPSTTIIIKSASFESQARQPAGLTRNAFGQPIPRPRFPSISHTVGGSSSGGSSNSQVRTGSSSSRGTSGGGARVQVSPRASSSRGTSGGGVRVQWSRG